MVEIRCGVCGGLFLTDGPDGICPVCFGDYKIAKARGEATVDMVAHPTHYTQGDIECKDAIRAALTEAEWRGYCKGNVLKYVWRERAKGKDEDLAKAKVYLGWLVDHGKG